VTIDETAAEGYAMSTRQSAGGHRVDTTNATLAYYNIVVVFPDLKFGPALSELARKLLHGHPSPLITEIPNQVLAVVYPDRQIQCQFANRRVDVRDSRGTTPGAEPFPQVVVNAVDAAREASGKEPVAYGYNYELDMPLGERDAGAVLRTTFFKRPSDIGDAFGGTVGAVGISASVTLPDGCQANFEIVPIPERAGYARAHVNYHYESGKPPSDPAALTQEVERKYDEFRVALDRL
jgi:hypothetical protein